MVVAIIGIDLGTSNSVVAYWDGKEAKVIKNNLGKTLTPSVISIDEKGDLHVGEIARERLISHPEYSVALFKRDMGTKKRITLGSHTYLPEELSSFVIRKLKEDAECFLKQEVNEAVISVPAYFNDQQRRATKRAAELSGLKVERLISEPTAAALSYGLHNQNEDSNFLVFDLGGGTFDVSILEKFSGVIQVRAIAGDNYLGGEDFTNAIFEYALSSQDLDRSDLTKSEEQILLKQSEKAKRLMNNSVETDFVFTVNNTERKTKLTRQKFEIIIEELALRLRAPILRAMNDAHLSSNEIDAVVLVGGATKMSIIKKLVGKIVGQIPFSVIDPDHTVAIGTAIQAALKERDENLKEIILTDVCPYTLGTEIVKQVENGHYEDGYYYPIIERNTPIPVSIVRRLYTVVDNQTSIVINVYQGEHRLTKDNLKIGEINVKVPPAPAGEECIDVRYTYDINGILEVEVTTVSTGIKNRIIIDQSSGDLSLEEIESRLQELSSIKIHPRDEEHNKLLISRAERLYEESLGDKRKYIEQLLDRFERVLDTQRTDIIKDVYLQLERELDLMERGNPFL